MTFHHKRFIFLQFAGCDILRMLNLHRVGTPQRNTEKRLQASSGNSLNLLNINGFCVGNGRGRILEARMIGGRFCDLVIRVHGSSKFPQ